MPTCAMFQRLLVTIGHCGHRVTPVLSSSTTPSKSVQKKGLALLSQMVPDPENKLEIFDFFTQELQKF
jgi:hypothetical protein